MEFIDTLEKILWDKNLLEGSIIYVSLRSKEERKKILIEADKFIPIEISRQANKFVRGIGDNRKYSKMLQRLGLNPKNNSKDSQLIKTAIADYLLIEAALLECYL